MILTADEKRLLILYYFGSAADTTGIVRDAMADITDPDERTAARNLLRKLQNMGEAEFLSLDPDGGTSA